MGRGDKEGADGAAVQAMRIVLPTVSMDGVVVIGEGEKDNAPMLFNGERIGDGSPPKADIAVDPIDGTTPTAARTGRGPGGHRRLRARAPCSTRARASTWRSWPSGPRRSAPSTSPSSDRDNLEAVAKAMGKSMRDVTVVILDRPRHAELIAEVRCERGPHQAHHRRRRRRGHLHGVARLGRRRPVRHRGHPRGRHRRRRPQVHGGRDPGPAVAPRRRRAHAAVDAGYDLDAVLTTDDLVRGDNCFFAATGITDGELLQGVRYHDFGATTQSLVMRSKSGTVRLVEARHPLDKLGEYSAIEFG